jgi:phosphate:Na+ symporter
MAGREIVMLAGAVLGGLAMFMFGMGLMSENIRAAAGPGMRRLLHRATCGRLRGYALGTALGALMHSSAATVMFVGFANAGLIRLPAAVPVVFGANLGTTFSMWVVSLRVDEYAWFGLAIGMLLQVLGPRPGWKIAGRALIGFSLLFLGMAAMSGAIRPHRELLQPWLARLGSDRLPQLLAGVGVALAVTMIIQSSGATMGMAYALIHAGALTTYGQIFPIVLGSALGTCTTALLASIGTRREARRVAAAHLLFNLINVTVALFARPLLFRFIPQLSPHLARQAAATHMVIMIIAGAVMLPWSTAFAGLVRRLLRGRGPEPEGSHLDEALLDRPEQALRAVILELRRVAGLCAESFHLLARIMLFETGGGRVERVRRNEVAVDEIKSAVRDYLARLTRRYLSRRQALLLQHLNRCTIDIERIGDHLEALCDLSLRRRREPRAVFDEEPLRRLFELHHRAGQVFELVLDSLRTDVPDYHALARRIRQARDGYVSQSIEAKKLFTEQLSSKSVSPIAGLYYFDYVAGFDRIVRHANNIALAESQPDFWIKQEKLDRVAPPALPLRPPPLVDPGDFLEKFHREKFL